MFPIAPAAIMAIAAAAQAAFGLIQKGEAAMRRRKARKEFDNYEIPKSATLALDKAQSLATLRGVPGEDIYRSRAQTSAAMGVESAARVAESPMDVLGLLSRMYGENMANFEQNMALSGMQAYERRQGNLMNALNRYSQFETEQWQYNELYPYMQAMGEAGQVDAAANANIGGGINAGMQTAGTQWDINTQQKQFEEYKKMKLGEFSAMRDNYNVPRQAPAYSAMNQKFAYPAFGANSANPYSFNPTTNYANWWESTSPNQQQDPTYPSYY